jgi:hypothetical protein
MRAVRPLLFLAAVALLFAAPDDAHAGKRGSSARAAKMLGGYTIPQIRRGARAKGHAALEGFKRSQQPKRYKPRQAAGGSQGVIGPDTLIRPATGPNDSVLKEFGLPYIAGVPSVALLFLPPPADEFTTIFGPGVLGVRPGR